MNWAGTLWFVRTCTLDAPIDSAWVAVIAVQARTRIHAARIAGTGIHATRIVTTRIAAACRIARARVFAAWIPAAWVAAASRIAGAGVFTALRAAAWSAATSRIACATNTRRFRRAATARRVEFAALLAWLKTAPVGGSLAGAARSVAAIRISSAIPCIRIALTVSACIGPGTFVGDTPSTAGTVATRTSLDQREQFVSGSASDRRGEWAAGRRGRVRVCPSNNRNRVAVWIGRAWHNYAADLTLRACPCNSVGHDGEDINFGCRPPLAGAGWRRERIELGLFAEDRGGVDLKVALHGRDGL